MKKINQFFVEKGAILILIWILQGCTQNAATTPCDNYGKHCEPKIKINQWTTHPY